MRTADLEPPEAILFDVGDTLVQATAIAEAALDRAAEWLAGRTPNFNRREFIDAYRTVDKRFDEPSTNHLWGVPLEIMVEACSFAGLSRSTGLAAGAVYRKEVRNRIVPDPAVTRVFSELQRQAIPIGVLSNGSTVEQLDTLILLSLIDFVDSLVISEDYGWLKPDPRLTKVALDELGARPERTWMVGDDVKSDGRAAAETGMVWVRVGEGEGHGDLNLAGVAELSSIIQGARAEWA